MTRTIVVLLAGLLLVACAGPRDEGDPPPEAGAPAAPPARVQPPDVPGADPPPAGPGRLENYPEEERTAWQENRNPGVAVIRAVDAGTGAPVPDQMHYGLRFAFAREDVDARPPVEVDWMGTEDVPDGTRRHALADGWWRLRLEADGYRHTWTPRFRVECGKTTEVTVRMLRANRLVVTVLEPDGGPCRDGTLLVREERRHGARPIRDGIVDTLVHSDEVEIAIDPRFMEGYRSWSRRVETSYGETTEVTVRLER